MVSSFVFWVLTFVITQTKVVFSTTIEKNIFERLEDGSDIYRIRVMNIGRRDLVEVSITAKIRIRINGSMRTTYLSLGDEQTIPILKGRDSKKDSKYSTYLPGLYVKEVARAEYSKGTYSKNIQTKAQDGTLRLEDLLREYGNNIDITVYLSGNDRLTGARKMFVSHAYTPNDIVEGRFRKWSGLPFNIQRFFNKGRVAQEMISKIDTADSILVETYIDPLVVLNNTNPRAKDEFLQDHTLRKPNNTYNELNILEINRKLERLNWFTRGADVSQSHTSETIADIMVLNRNRLALQFVASNYEYSHCKDSEKPIVAKKHKELNYAMYGKPEKEVFESIIRYKQGKSISEDMFYPQKHLYERFSEVINNYMSEMFDFIPPEKSVFTVEEACHIANTILKEHLHASELGWKAIVEPNNPSASVSQKERLVKFPGKRSKGDYTLHDLRAIIAHEIGVHVNRALIPNRLGSFALSVGLPNYESFEEGLAVAVEKAVNNDEYLHPGIRHYISIGLAEFEGLDFRDVFEKELSLFGYSEESRKVTFDSVQRAFRGTGELINSKDLVYYNGAEQLWLYIEEMIDSPHFLTYLFERGKIDASNPEHRFIADSIIADSSISE